MIGAALTAQFLLWMAVSLACLTTHRPSVFHPAVWYLGFHGLVFVLRPIFVHMFGFDTIWAYMLYRPAETVFLRTLAISSVGMLVFVAACLAFSWKRLAQPQRPTPGFTATQRGALALTTFLLAPLVAYSIYATREGILGERVAGVYIMTQSVGYINDAQFLATPLLCAWLVVTRFHWLNLLPVGTYLGYRIWFGWSRWSILLFMAMVVVAFCWQRQRRWPPAWWLIAALPFLILFNTLGHNRDYLKALIEGRPAVAVEQLPGETRSERIRRRFDTQDFANFDYLSYVVGVVPERTGAFTLGTQYLQLLTEPVPRRLWKQKPIGPPVKRFDLGAYGNFTGLTVSLVGDGWMSAGWGGVILTLGLAGGFLGWAYDYFRRHSHRPLPALLFISGLAMSPQWFRDGGISIAKFMFWTWLPLLLWWGLAWWLGRRLHPVRSVTLPARTRLKLLEAPLAPLP